MIVVRRLIVRFRCRVLNQHYSDECRGRAECARRLWAKEWTARLKREWIP